MYLDLMKNIRIFIEQIDNFLQTNRGELVPVKRFELEKMITWLEYEQNKGINNVREIKGNISR